VKLTKTELVEYLLSSLLFLTRFTTLVKEEDNTNTHFGKWEAVQEDYNIFFIQCRRKLRSETAVL
jgi:hypothetical protein